MHSKVKNFCESIDIETLDLFPYFEGKDNIQLQTVEIHDNHPNAMAHRMMAEIIYDYLKKRYSDIFARDKET